jgi:hypothetical protein
LGRGVGLLLGLVAIQVSQVSLFSFSFISVFFFMFSILLIQNPVL